MSQSRRTVERRRRVLYSTQSDTGPSTAASRREAERLREARCPSATYGSRVHRRLRGRWFGLVPVRRRTMAVVVVSLVGAALMLCLFHYAAVTWPSIADRGEIARPLRLDRADSFGGWFIGMLMIGSAGASFLIYQLRRHRLDDFRGHYRLWRIVLIVMVLASLNSIVSLIDWSGALLDASIGKRVALAGADWIRIVVSLGGAVLVLRLVAEVRRSRGSLLAMLVAAGFLMIPEAVRWNLMTVETIERWVWVTSAPLLAQTSLFIAFGIYLRKLYREVRRLDQTDSLRDRIGQMRLRVFRVRESDDETTDDEATDDEATGQQPKPVRKRWWARKRELAAVEADADDDGEEQSPRAKTTDRAPAKPKRRWLGLRAAQRETDESTAETDSPSPRQTRKRRFLRRRDTAADHREQAAKAPAAQPANASEAQPDPQQKPQRRGLGGFLRKSAPRPPADDEQVKFEPDPGPATGQSEDDYIDPDGIDWGSLSKSERRRLKKQLKRQNRAA